MLTNEQKTALAGSLWGLAFQSGRAIYYCVPPLGGVDTG